MVHHPCSRTNVLILVLIRNNFISTLSLSLSLSHTHKDYYRVKYYQGCQNKDLESIGTVSDPVIQLEIKHQNGGKIRHDLIFKIFKFFKLLNIKKLSQVYQSYKGYQGYQGY